MFTQCKLQKGNSYQIAHIPSKWAKLNEFVKLKMKGIWDDGWKVVDVGGQYPDNVTQDHSRDFKKTRGASDI